MEMKACADAVAWAKQFPTAQEAWEACERPDWMFWVAGKFAKSQQAQCDIVRAGAACVRTGLKYVPAGGTYPLLAAIEAAEQWAEDPSKENGTVAVAAEAAAWANVRAYRTRRHDHACISCSGYTLLCKCNHPGVCPQCGALMERSC